VLAAVGTAQARTRGPSGALQSGLDLSLAELMSTRKLPFLLANKIFSHEIILLQIHAGIAKLCELIQNCVRVHEGHADTMSVLEALPSSCRIFCSDFLCRVIVRALWGSHAEKLVGNISLIRFGKLRLSAGKLRHLQSSSLIVGRKTHAGDVWARCPNVSSFERRWL